MFRGSRGRAVAVTYGAGGNAPYGASLFFGLSCRSSPNLESWSLNLKSNNCVDPRAMRPFALFRCRGYVRGTAQARKMVSSTSEFSSSARVETLLLASPKLEFALENSFRLEKAPAWRHPRVLSVEGPALCSAQGRPVAWGEASARGGTVDRLQESAYAYRVTHPLHIGSLLRAAVRALLPTVSNLGRATAADLIVAAAERDTVHITAAKR